MKPMRQFSEEGGREIEIEEENDKREEKQDCGRRYVRTRKSYAYGGMRDI